MANGHGGARPGSGRPPGRLNDLTVAKNELRQAVFERLKAEVGDVLHALLARAKGTKYLVYRDEHGKYVTVSARQAKRLKELNLTRLEIWERPPDADAIRQILDRVIDPPKAAVDVTVSGDAELLERLDKAKVAAGLAAVIPSESEQK